MKCNKCKTEVSVSTKFCPNCGAQLSSENDEISFSDINIDWLKNSLKLLDYELSQDNCGENEIKAIKEKHVSIFLKLDKDIKVITLMSYLSLKKITRTSKSELLEILNMSNGKGTYCTFFVNMDNQVLNIYSYIPILDKITKQLILNVIEKYNEELISTVNMTKLIDYIGD